MKFIPADEYTRRGGSVSPGVNRGPSKKARRAGTRPAFVNYMRCFLWNTMISITIIVRPIPASIM